MALNHPPPDTRIKSAPLHRGRVVKSVLMQTSDETRYAKMLDVTSANTKVFCNRHGLEHRIFRGLKRGRWNWHSTFNRLYMFEELITEGHDGWAIYLDADAFIVDLDFPIKEYLESKDTSAGIVIHSGATPAYWDINSGVMFLNLRNPIARAIVKDWIRRHEEIVEETQYISPQRPPYFGDQRLIQHALRDNQAWFDALHVESQDLMNSMHASFIRHHIRAITPDFDRRLAALQLEVNEVMKRFRCDP